MRVIKFFLPGVIPSKKNNQQIRINKRTGKRFITSSNRHKQWEKTAQLTTLNRIVANSNLKDNLIKLASISITIIFPDRRVRDLPGCLESIADLIKNRIITDDCWTVMGDISIRGFLGDEPGALIIIRECEDD